MTSGSQRGEVRHLAAGDESNAGRARKIEELEQPFTRDLLDDRHGRRGDENPAVLIPRTGQPIGGQRDGERTADDESEVARTGAPHDSAVRAAAQRVDHLRGVLPLIRQRHRQCGEKVLTRSARADRALGKSAKKVDRAIVRAAQKGLVNELPHTRIMYTISTDKSRLDEQSY